MRCFCCNSVMSYLELLRVKRDDSQEDMCTECLVSAEVLEGEEVSDG